MAYAMLVAATAKAFIGQFLAVVLFRGLALSVVGFAVAIILNGGEHPVAG